MKSRGFAFGAFAAAVVAVGLSACGGSTSTSSSGGGGASQTSAPAISIPAGSSFCTEARGIGTQLSHIGSSIVGSSPGATPDVTAFHQIIATVTSAIDALDASAPSEIAAAFHTLRSTYDQLNTQAQSATTLEQVSAMFASLDTQAVKDADAAITSYLGTTCGVTPTP